MLVTQATVKAKNKTTKFLLNLAPGRRLVRHLRPQEPDEQEAQGGGQQEGQGGVQAVAVLCRVGGLLTLGHLV